ncbi:MAG TPA: hypothetical protein VFO46_14565 [Candidatus Sulfotelmatobacter sp.]|nr:hypothetical protein [Candidatus Sulfotelmatobacter sp.]
MRKIILSLWLLLLVSGLNAQSSPEEKKEKETIQHAKGLLVSTLDRSLPKVSLEYFLKYESAGAPIHWEVNDCGEQTGDPAVDKDRDLPICVEADFDVDHRAITIFIAVGTLNKGVSGDSALFSATITEADGKVKSLRQLGELPKELHRPLPKSPRDVPDPAGGI